MKPRIFIGSSSESIDVVKAVQYNLKHLAEITAWTQGVFKLSQFTLTNLKEALDSADYGIFVLNEDDVALIRNEVVSMPRDNVIFELGLFAGKLGIENCFFLIPSDANELHLPSDLNGLKPGVFENDRSDGDLIPGTADFCYEVERSIKEFANLRESLTGDWDARWHVPQKPGDSNILVYDKALLRQNNDQVTGTFVFDGRVYKISGSIHQDSYFTGLWEDTKKGSTYNGAFQLKIHPNAKTMEGVWLGYGTKGDFKNGVYEWKRTDITKYYSEEKNDLL